MIHVLRWIMPIQFGLLICIGACAIWLYCIGGMNRWCGGRMDQHAETEMDEESIVEAQQARVEKMLGTLDPTKRAVVKVITARVARAALERVRNEDSEESSLIMRIGERTSNFVAWLFRRQRREPIQPLDSAATKHV